MFILLFYWYETYIFVGKNTIFLHNLFARTFFSWLTHQPFFWMFRRVGQQSSGSLHHPPKIFSAFP